MSIYFKYIKAKIDYYYHYLVELNVNLNRSNGNDLDKQPIELPLLHPYHKYLAVYTLGPRGLSRVVHDDSLFTSLTGQP